MMDSKTIEHTTNALVASQKNIQIKDSFVPFFVFYFKNSFVKQFFIVHQSNFKLKSTKFRK